MLPSVHISDHGLRAFVDVHMLHPHVLVTTVTKAAISLELPLIDVPSQTGSGPRSQKRLRCRDDGCRRGSVKDVEIGVKLVRRFRLGRRRKLGRTAKGQCSQNKEAPHWAARKRLTEAAWLASLWAVSFTTWPNAVLHSENQFHGELNQSWGVCLATYDSEGARVVDVG